ncbi:MAG: TrkH family potassium uptake protein [Erysipelothrix sp.]|nr:TrkH family potassium uptake protein [Erysipelothrix sp.]
MSTRFFVDSKLIILRPAQQIVLGFLTVIFVGSVLLSLPIAQQIPTSYLDHLFIATSAVCVTGLSPLVVAESYTIFGQVVVMLLMQIGGLSLMTFIALFMIAIGGKLNIHDKIIMQETLNRTSLTDITKFIVFILKYTLFFEVLGFVLLATQFVPLFGLGEGLYKSLFISISAFNNAGFDILGAVSLQNFVSNPVVNFTVMIQIIMGGLGFSVWFDLQKSSSSIIKRIPLKRIFNRLKVHVKLVLIVTAILILSGWLFIFLAEYSNPASLGSLSLIDKLMASLFQSVTLRTAGFSTLNIADLRPATLVIMMLFMFIGGSPGGTAGGIKTTTMALVVLYVITELRNKDSLVLFKKTISRDLLRRAVTILVLSLVIVFSGIVGLLFVQQGDALTIVFEAVSAMGTVGLSMGITPFLNSWGKGIIIVLMFIGRIGPVAVAYTLKSNRVMRRANLVEYPQGQVIVG